MLVPFFTWVQETGFFSYIRSSAYAYPVLLWMHMVALVFLGGMIIVTDLRLLGLAMRSYSVSGIVNGLRVPKRVSFIAAVACGVLMFGSKAGQYAHNRWFWIKIALLVLIAANYLIFRRGVFDAGRAKLAAG